MKNTLAIMVVLAALTALADPLHIDVSKKGIAKHTVAIEVANPAFAKCLRRNLEISGLFQVGRGGSITVSGGPGAVKVSGSGKALDFPAPMPTEAEARMAARRLSDAMCEAYGRQKGFACDQMAFVSRKGRNQSELCVCYPDGYDIRQVSADGNAVVGPRWKDRATLFYTNLKAGPQIWELDTATGRRKLRWSFKGLTTGAAVSPDGRRVAIILSFQGNPELYVIDLASGRWERLTKTPNASEGQPAWSPDGRAIVYVSNETRHPQLFVIDVATKAKRRLTSRGTQNVDPDWGADGRITYITKRPGGSQIAILDPAVGDSAAVLVTRPGNWEHPSWSRDRRHVVAGSDHKLFIVDTLPDGDDPKPVFNSNGSWITPCWSR